MPSAVLPVHCFHHPDYTFPLPVEHPFPMDKFWRSADMLREAAHPAVKIYPATHATETDLLRVHTAAYLAKIRTGSLDSAEAVKLGLPAGEPLLLRSRLEVGGTLAAMHAALADGLACNLAGGTHHAFADRGLGYCVLNDVAIAIRVHHANNPSARIAVIDTDAHQGNGTHGIFAGDDRVFTYSIHVGKNYPAQKTPGRLDVELPRFVHGADYLEQLESTLAPAIDDFAPDLVFWIRWRRPARKRPLRPDATHRHRPRRPRPPRARSAHPPPRPVGRALWRRLQPRPHPHRPYPRSHRPHRRRLFPAHHSCMNSPRTCPLCGRPNQCDLAAGKSQCWCFQLTVPPELLARVPVDQQHDVCICRECILEFHQSDPGNAQNR